MLWRNVGKIRKIALVKSESRKLMSLINEFRISLTLKSQLKTHVYFKDLIWQSWHTFKVP